MFKYLTTKWHTGIRKVKIERETEYFVYIKSISAYDWSTSPSIRKEGKVSSDATYHDTFQEAKSFKLQSIQNDINMYKTKLDQKREEFGKVQALTEEDCI